MRQVRTRISTIVLVELFIWDKMPNYRALEHKASEAGLYVSASLLQRDHEL